MAAPVVENIHQLVPGSRAGFVGQTIFAPISITIAVVVGVVASVFRFLSGYDFWREDATGGLKTRALSWLANLADIAATPLITLAQLVASLIGIVHPSIGHDLCIEVIQCSLILGALFHPSKPLE